MFDCILCYILILDRWLVKRIYGILFRRLCGNKAEEKKVQTFPHDIVEELHDGDPPVRVTVQQLGVNSGCEEFSESKKEKKTIKTLLKHINGFTSKSVFA